MLCFIQIYKRECTFNQTDRVAWRVCVCMSVFLNNYNCHVNIYLCFALYRFIKEKVHLIKLNSWDSLSAFVCLPVLNDNHN